MTTVAFKGWNSATQGWGGGTYGNDVAFPSSTSALNGVTITGDANISVTGIAGTTALGNTFETVNGVSATASLQITLPSAAGYLNGQYFVIKDEAGNANIYNITIKTAGSETIDGVTSVVLESPFASISLYSNGSNKFFIY